MTRTEWIDWMNEYLCHFTPVLEFMDFSRLTGKNYNFRFYLDTHGVLSLCLLRNCQDEWAFLSRCLGPFCFTSFCCSLYFLDCRGWRTALAILVPARCRAVRPPLGSLPSLSPRGRRTLCFAAWPAQPAGHVCGCVRATRHSACSRANFSGLKAISPGLGLDGRGVFLLI